MLLVFEFCSLSWCSLGVKMLRVSTSSWSILVMATLSFVLDFICILLISVISFSCPPTCYMAHPYNIWVSPYPLLRCPSSVSLPSVSLDSWCLDSLFLPSNYFVSASYLPDSCSLTVPAKLTAVNILGSLVERKASCLSAGHYLWLKINLEKVIVTDQ